MRTATGEKQRQTFACSGVSDPLEAETPLGCVRGASSTVLFQSSSHERCVRCCAHTRAHAHTHAQSDCYSALEMLPVSKRPAPHTEFFKHALQSGVDLSAAASVSAALPDPAPQTRRRLSSSGGSGLPGAPTLGPLARPRRPSVPVTVHACVLALLLCSHLGFPCTQMVANPPAVREAQV